LREGAILQEREPFFKRGSHSSKEDVVRQQGREDVVLQEREGAIRQRGMGDAVLQGREDHRWGMGDAVLHLREDTVCRGREDKLDDVVGRKNNAFPNAEIHCST